VPADAPPWLREAGQHWREQAGTGFIGCVDAALNTLLATQQRAQSILALSDAASGQLASLTDAAGYLPASWLNSRHISGDAGWTSRNVRHDCVQQIKDAFAALVRGELLTTPATSPVLPRPGQQTGNPGTQAPV
jgi:hypothetical protein